MNAHAGIAPSRGTNHTILEPHGDGAPGSPVVSWLIRAGLLIVLVHGAIGCKSHTEVSEERTDNAPLPALPGLLAGLSYAECDGSRRMASFEEFAALPPIWFYGEILDVYPETEVGSTVTFRRSGYEGELFQPLESCAYVSGQLLVDVRIDGSIGEPLPERVTFVVDVDWMTPPLQWDGYDTYFWDEVDGAPIGFAPGQRIGGATTAFSTRYERARMFSRPSFPLFSIGADGQIRFQEVHRNDDAGLDCAPRRPSFLQTLEAMSPADLLAHLDFARTSDEAIRGEQLTDLRREMMGGLLLDINSEVMSGIFFPHCSPADHEIRGREEPPSGLPDPPMPENLPEGSE